MFPNLLWVQSCFVKCNTPFLISQSRMSANRGRCRASNSEGENFGSPFERSDHESSPSAFTVWCRSLSAFGGTPHIVRSFYLAINYHVLESGLEPAHLMAAIGFGNKVVPPPCSRPKNLSTPRRQKLFCLCIVMIPRKLGVTRSLANWCGAATQ